MSAPSDGREIKETTGLAIINPCGALWTDEIFDSPQAALKYLKKHHPKAEIEEFKLAQAVKTVKVYRPEGEPTFVPFPT